ncbi:hypothetical protein JTE90_022457 [Oedothorax gibbosus]|uniref:Protein FAM219A n=1 Tax=Oedothorax gibbosus TaxID=931172 RepID=A0AAV6TYB3_9ARAC|nr:hypothetical protein JTE90_022457 [Oedothorax gibbosus]
MEDSGIDSDSKPGFLRLNRPYVAIPDHDEEQDEEINSSETTNSFDTPLEETEEVCYKGPFKTQKFKTASILQKRMEKQMLQTRKMRQKEQNFEAVPKKLIPRSRLKVPKSQVPLVTKTDSHPLVSWESESDDDIDYHPISKSTSKEISEQLIKDGYNLDLTPDDEDLDLIPPKPLTNKCICCSLNCMCTIQ